MQFEKRNGNRHKDNHSLFPDQEVDPLSPSIAFLSQVIVMFAGQRAALLLTRPRVAHFSQVPAVHQSISGRTRFYKKVDVIPTPDGKAGQVFVHITSSPVLYHSNHHESFVVFYYFGWTGSEDAWKKPVDIAQS